MPRPQDPPLATRRSTCLQMHRRSHFREQLVSLLQLRRRLSLEDVCQ